MMDSVIESMLRGTLVKYLGPNIVHIITKLSITQNLYSALKDIGYLGTR